MKLLTERTVEQQRVVGPLPLSPVTTQSMSSSESIRVQPESTPPRGIGLDSTPYRLFDLTGGRLTIHHLKLE